MQIIAREREFYYVFEKNTLNLLINKSNKQLINGLNTQYKVEFDTFQQNLKRKKEI